MSKTISDLKRSSLASLGYTGSIVDTYRTFLMAQLGVSSGQVNDLEDLYLLGTGTIEDKWRQHLDLHGITNLNLNDAEHEYWSTVGAAGLVLPYLFSNNEKGVWFDPYDTATVFQDAAGTIAGVVGQPVGKLLDKSGNGYDATQASATAAPLYRGVPRTLGSELAVNGRFDADTDWTKGTGWTIAAGVATKVAGTASEISEPITLTPGTTYQISYTMTRTAGTLTAQFTGGTTITGVANNATRSTTDILTAVTGNTTLSFSADIDFAGTLDNVTIKEVTAFTNLGLAFDGINDLIVTPAIDMSASKQATVIMFITRDHMAGTHSILDAGGFVGTAVDGSYNLLFSGGLQGRTRQGANLPSSTISDAREVPVAQFGDRAFAIELEIDRTKATVAEQIILRLRKTTIAQTPAGVAVADSVLANGALTLGAAANASLFYNGIIGRVVKVNRLLTAAEKAAVLSWVTYKSPVCAVIGDSTIAANSAATGQPSENWNVSSFIGGMICGGADISLPGDKIADQKVDWTALTGKDQLQAVFVQIGLNDIRTFIGGNTKTSAQVIADLQDLIDTINTDKPAGCRTYISGLTPCKLWLDGATNPAAAYQGWLDVNEAISGGGTTPITGVDARITSHVAALNDGSGNLLPIYDYNGDGVHESNEARFIIAQAWRTQLEADELIV